MIEPGELISEPAIVVAIDYATIAATDFGSRVELHATRDGIAHGFALCSIRCSLPASVSRIACSPPTIYGRSFVPFESPVDLMQGDAIVVDLAARFLNDADDYLWLWNTS